MRYLATADWHLRDDQPECRKDILLDTLVQKVLDIQDIAAEEGVDGILLAGDVFHKWKSSPYLLWQILDELMPGIPTYAIPGQHDLPSHRLSEYHKSALAVLEAAGVMHVVSDGIGTSDYVMSAPYGEEPEDTETSILMMHRFVYDGDKPFPGVPKEALAKNVLKKYKNHDIIITGDNHQSFVTRHKGRVLVNPGSLSRQTADQANHEPAVYIVDTDHPTHVERIAIPCLPSTEVLSRKHIEKEQEKEERVEAFIDKLKDDSEWSISFEENMKTFLLENDIEQKTKELIAEYMEEDK